MILFSKQLGNLIYFEIELRQREIKQNLKKGDTLGLRT